MKTSVLWFRDDLRVADNPALVAACAEGNVVGLYILDEVSEGIRPLGGAAKWWLHHALTDLRQELAALGIPLALRRGPAASIFEELEPAAVLWNRRYGGPERKHDAGIKASLRARGVHVASFQASLLHEPWTLKTGVGNPYQVFTPFWNALSQHDFRPALDTPEAGSGGTLDGFDTEDLKDWQLLPQRPNWATGLAERWTATAQAGHQALADFLEERVVDYDDARDRPAVFGTSGLSPYLRWGQLSPFQVFQALRERRNSGELGDGGGAATFAKELGWREFCWHQLYHHPDLATQNLRPKFDNYPWWTPSNFNGESEPGTELAQEYLLAWQKGLTGIPLVDAGQRELWATGYMHNRVRMVAASFLVKNLGIHWRVGEQWFWDTLVDADSASNPANWQWVAGSGADASPFFRVFNPQTQAAKFDPQGGYVNRWVPEWLMPHYPEPVVDLKESRVKALEGLELTKNHVS